MNIKTNLKLLEKDDILDMYDLQVNGIYDNYECVRRKRKLRKMIKKNIDI